MGAVSDTVERASKLTSQLLAFARRQPLNPQVFDVGVRVRNIGEMLESLTGARIRARGDTNVQDAVTRTTGISFTGSPGNGGSAYSARGFVGDGSVMR